MRKSLVECEILLVLPEDDLLMHDELVPVVMNLRPVLARE